MAAVGYVVKQFKLKAVSTQYESATTSIQSSISVAQQTSQVGIANGTITDSAPPVETLTVAYNVDHGTSSLYTFLRANVGATVAVEYESGDGKAKYTGTVLVGPPQANANVGDFETGTVDLTVQGGLLTRTSLP